MHRRLVYPLVDFVLPTACFACREPLGALQRLGACAACWTGLRVLRGSLCTACGTPRPDGTDLLGPARGRCIPCILAPGPADAVRAVVVYDDVARAYLLRAKLGGRPELLRPLASQLARAVQLAGWRETATVVVPVPSHPWVSLRRGFSPGVELARTVARALKLPLCSRALGKRWRTGLSVKRLGARARRAAGAGAVRVRRRVRGDRVLLVDDVMTTGATVESCCRALRAAGALEVRVAVWARTLRSG